MEVHILNLRSLLATQMEKTKLELEVQPLCGQILAVLGSFGWNASFQQEYRVKKDEVGILICSNFKRKRECNFWGGKRGRGTKKNQPEIHSCEP